MNEPSDDTGVFKSQEAFVAVMLKVTTPTLLSHGCNFTNSHMILFQTLFPVQFPFGLCGLDINRGTAVSNEEYTKQCMQLSLPQFYQQDFILVLLGIYNQIKSCYTGIV